MAALESDFLVPGGTVLVVLVLLAVAGLVVLCAIGGLVWFLARRQGREAVRDSSRPVS